MYKIKNNKNVSFDSRYLGILGVIVAVAVIFTLMQKNYMSVTNIHDMMLNASLPIIISLGMAIVLAVGGFDMSIGHVCGFAAMTCAILIQKVQWPIPLAILAALAVATAIGFANGLIITRLGVPSFIATLGMQFVLVGVRFWVTNGQTITNFPREFTGISKGNALGFSNVILYMVIAVVVFAIIMSRFKFGRKLTAVGSNIQAARLSGINISRYTVAAFMISSLMAGITGILLLSRNGMEHVAMGDGYLIQAITISVFSGVIFSRFNSVGVFLAAMVITMITVGIAMVGFDPNITNLIIGLILVAVILLGKAINSDKAKNRKAKKLLDEWYARNESR